MIEHILLNGADESWLRTAADLRMLAFTGGRERTFGDLERLAADAGLRVGDAHRVGRYRSVIELRL